MDDLSARLESLLRRHAAAIDHGRDETAQGKYPPAEPGALGIEPLKAAISGGPLPSLTQGHSLSTASNRPSQFPKRLVCGASRDIAAIAAVS